jgi:hypothetical protein
MLYIFIWFIVLKKNWPSPSPSFAFGDSFALNYNLLHVWFYIYLRLYVWTCNLYSAQNRSFFSFYIPRLSQHDPFEHPFEQWHNTNINDIFIRHFFFFTYFFDLFSSSPYWLLLINFISWKSCRQMTLYMIIYLPTYNCSLIFNGYVDVYVSLFTEIQLILL